MDLSLFPPPLSFPFLPSPLSLFLSSRAFFLFFFSCPRRGGSGSPPMSLLLLSLSSFFFYTLLCILIASLSICTSFFLFGVPVPLLCRVVSFCQPLSRSFCHCLFPSYPRGSHSFVVSTRGREPSRLSFEEPSTL